ncbi:uncharacterized protein LOC123209946 isoform X3 [Mangifera indica]|uniref:uncharacterized protein LOC123209946 isoform X3 n=1 Tax=Mangifera indica TaxID=29780 RepID=UPI001CFAEBE3|nr:uncharacterized protein LOC123209946 isoform X3 [Mangifera indica]
MNSAQVKRFDALSMEKHSPESLAICEKCKSGCAWCLNGLFDFSQGHSNKEMISNRERPYSNVADIIREAELGSALRIKKKITTGTENGLEKNHRREANMSFRRHGCKDIENAVHTRPSSDQPFENSVGMSSRTFNGAASTKTSCNQVHPKTGKVCHRRGSSQINDQLSEINLKVKMSEATEAFINQKIIKGKCHSRDRGSNRSKHFLDALEILNCNKGLFIKLLHDPNSLLVKHIQDLRDSQVKNQETKLSETCDRCSSTRSVDPPSNRILLLKSGSSGSTCMQKSSGENRDFSSQQSLYSLRHRAQSGKPAYFSFEHMKRMLRHAIGLSRKEKPLLSTVTLHKSSRDIQKLGNGSKGNDLGITGSSSPHKIYCGSVDNKMGDKVNKAKDFDSGTKQKIGSNSGTCHENLKLSFVRHPKQSELNPYMESIKHLPEVFTNRDEVLSRNQFPRTLESIVSLPEYYAFSTLSPGRHWEHGFIAEQTRFSTFTNHQMVTEKRNMIRGKNKNHHLSSLRQSSKAAPSWADNERHTSQTFGTKSKIAQSHPSGSMKVVETYNTTKEGKVSSSGAVEPNEPNYTGANQNAVIATTVEENSLECSKLDSPEENFTPVSPEDVFTSSSLSSKHFENSAAMKDKAKHQSQVSVLEKFVENITSLPSIVSQPADLTAVPKHNNSEQCSAALMMFPVDLKINSGNNVINEHEPMCKYMRAMLEASDMNWDKLLIKCHSSDQLLDPSLFNEVAVLPNQFCVDHMLLFAYINEVLGKLCQSYFNCSPWLSFVKRIQPSKDMVYEVMKHVDWSLLVQQSSPILDKLIEKDLARSQTWMNIQIEAEDIVAEMVESLLEELILEIATSWVFEDLHFAL